MTTKPASKDPLDPSNWQAAGPSATTKVGFFQALGLTNLKMSFGGGGVPGIVMQEADAHPSNSDNQNQNQNQNSTGSGSIPALPKSGRYSFSQLEDIWVAAGGNKRYEVIAAAVAMAESGGVPNAVNTANSNGTTDRGLWQINSSHGAQSTFNVLKNAQAAVAISFNGSNWNAWTTFTSGAWRKYVPNSIPAGQILPTTAGRHTSG